MTSIPVTKAQVQRVIDINREQCMAGATGKKDFVLDHAQFVAVLSTLLALDLISIKEYAGLTDSFTQEYTRIAFNYQGGGQSK